MISYENILTKVIGFVSAAALLKISLMRQKRAVSEAQVNQTYLKETLTKIDCFKLSSQYSVRFVLYMYVCVLHCGVWHS